MRSGARNRNREWLEGTAAGGAEVVAYVEGNPLHLRLRADASI